MANVLAHFLQTGMGLLPSTDLSLPHTFLLLSLRGNSLGGLAQSRSLALAILHASSQTSRETGNWNVISQGSEFQSLPVNDKILEGVGPCVAAKR